MMHGQKAKKSDQRKTWSIYDKEPNYGGPPVYVMSANGLNLVYLPPDIVDLVVTDNAEALGHLLDEHQELHKYLSMPMECSGEPLIAWAAKHGFWNCVLAMLRHNINPDALDIKSMSAGDSIRSSIAASPPAEVLLAITEELDTARLPATELNSRASPWL